MIMFDLTKLKNQVPKEQVKKLTQEIRAEFPDDEMMFELHLLRALKAIVKEN